MSCVEKACVWPAGANGYCVQHARMFEEVNTGRYAAVRLPEIPEIKAVAWTVGQRATEVLINGELWDWRAKMPYEASGFSVKGAVEHDPKTGEFKCHECGNWFKGLGVHVAAKNLAGSHSDYLNRHGFRAGAGLHRSTGGKWQHSHVPAKGSIKTRANMSHAREVLAKLRETEEKGWSTATLNLVGRCKAQTSECLRELAERLGRTPTTHELNAFTNKYGKHVLCYQRLERVFKAPLAEVLEKHGFEPRVRGQRAA